MQTVRGMGSMAMSVEGQDDGGWGRQWGSIWRSCPWWFMEISYGEIVQCVHVGELGKALEKA